jgi:hypothetical protein
MIFLATYSCKCRSKIPFAALVSFVERIRRMSKWRYHLESHIFIGTVMYYCSRNYEKAQSIYWRKAAVFSPFTDQKWTISDINFDWHWYPSSNLGLWSMIVVSRGTHNLNESNILNIVNENVIVKSTYFYALIMD